MTKGDESGAAVVDFVLVAALVSVMFLALIQLAVVLHVRNTVADAASSAARYGALADRSTQDAQDRAELLLKTALGDGYAQAVSAEVTSSQGVSIMSVSILAPLPLIGLFGPGKSLEMSGHALIPK
ncbi:TadE/TadG family type IV pilus assembly protein [Arthrobacter cryoconiti]|uniref:TadE/TadG family type IV pilus assembly protein n=1 Tax=Arthrobacter cryoconiti TaxID=748907 RepID=A0ABV8QWT4_9MICC|nr:TadE family protein [Arthrobacter cryoconiti]MCC9068999.1 pilus assembly protein [Arthrobacter cryoconiti]